jgi:hypothetical protein
MTAVQTPPAPPTSLQPFDRVAPNHDDAEWVDNHLLRCAVAWFDTLVAAGDSRRKRQRTAAQRELLHSLADRLCSTGLCTAPTLVYAAALLRRVATLDPRIITSANAPRVLVAAIVIAGKIHDDRRNYTVSAFAAVANITVPTLREAERQLFQRLDYNAGMSLGEFSRGQGAVFDAPVPIGRSPTPSPDGSDDEDEAARESLLTTYTGAAETLLQEMSRRLSSALLDELSQGASPSTAFERSLRGVDEVAR